MKEKQFILRLFICSVVSLSRTEINMLFEENKYPSVKSVKGIKHNRTGYNSEKDFIYHLQNRP